MGWIIRNRDWERRIDTRRESDKRIVEAEEHWDEFEYTEPNDHSVISWFSKNGKWKTIGIRRSLSKPRFHDEEVLLQEWNYPESEGSKKSTWTRNLLSLVLRRCKYIFR